MESEMPQPEIQKISRPLSRNFFVLGSGIAVGFVLVLLWVLFVPSVGFPVGETVVIPRGVAVSEVADILKERNAVSSSFLFRVYMKIFKSGNTVFAGAYLLDEKQSLFGITDRITSGDFRLESMKILITEGMDVLDIAKKLKTDLPYFDDKKFIELATKEEGYLFPDTYFFIDGASAESVVMEMKDNFTKRIADLKQEISVSGHTLAEIVTMASIIEREAVTPKDRRIISGVLWKRISIGMPLQVDATFDYINGKGTSSLTIDDLKIDSLYNTYVHRGLPRGPIGNPGFDCIVAALEPEKTSYLYYLSDKSGTIHYAKTFEEHVKNKMKYLK